MSTDTGERPQTFLIQVDGPDKAGITTHILGTLARAGARIDDVEQIVIRNHISLNIVACLPDGQDLLKELLLVGWEHGLQIEFEPVDSTPSRKPTGTIVTVLGATVGAGELAAVTGVMTEAGANVDRVERLSKYPAWSYQLQVSGGDTAAIRAGLVRLRQTMSGIDVAVQPKGLPRRALRAMVLDVDRTLVQNEMIDEIAELAGVGADVAEITERAMRGELDFREALEARVALLAGQPATILDEAWDRLELTPGARTFISTLRHLGFRIAIVSGGFTAITERLKTELDLDYAFANTLEVRDGLLTGLVAGPIVDRRRKADLLETIAQSEGLATRQVVAVGDGANDIDMLEAAGLGIAFNAKSVVGRAADAELNLPYLDAILFMLGVSREDIESEAGLTRQGPEID
ncbi:MAG: phosphoserine phosphatase SerB [Actinomycetota bacterium]